MAPSPRRRSNARLLLEADTEGTLVGISHLQRDRVETQGLVMQQRLGAQDSLPPQPGVRRATHRLLEYRCEMTRRQADKPRNVYDRHLSAEVVHHEIAGAP